MIRVSFNVVTWNGARYLPDLFSSLHKQTEPPTAVRIIDNASDDGTLALLSEEPGLTVIRNARNVGFAEGHNRGIRFALDKWAGEDLAHCYVVVANQDLVLTPTFLERVVAVLEAHPDVGSAQGKLLRAFVEHPEDDYLAETVCADVVDSTGLVIRRSGAAADRGAGAMDGGQFETEEEIFGPTGALAVYRASALADVRFEDEFFDADFFLYQEDVDLAWRLRWAGWKSLYVPSAVAYHHRGLLGSERPGLFERVQNRRRKRPMLAMLSTRNRILMLFKNLSFVNAVLLSPWILAREARQMLYSLILERHVIGGVLLGVRLLPRMWRKRRATFRSAKASSKDLRRFF